MLDAQQAHAASAAWINWFSGCVGSASLMHGVMWRGSLSAVAWTVGPVDDVAT
jgi:hypothetical protein